MKKILAIACVALAAVSMASAKGFSPVVGVHAFGGEGWGTTFASEDSDNKVTKPFGDNLYYGAGIFTNIKLDKKWGIQPEVNFMVNNIGKQNVTSSSLLNTTITTDTVYTYNTLDIPVLVTYKYSNFTFLLGPSLSIYLNRDYNVKTVTVTKTNSNTSTSTSSGTASSGIANPVNVGLTAGMDYEYKIGPGSLLIGGRYNLDFLPTYYTTTSSKDNGDGNTTTTKNNLWTRRFLTIDIGYKMTL